MHFTDAAWEDLALLLAALDTGSLSRAASSLGVSQSTASRRLQRLEEVVQGTLFDRRPEGLAPTALALELAPHARAIGEQMREIQRVASGYESAPRGRVRLALVDGLGPHLLLPGLPELRARHPELELDLLAGTEVLDLVRGEADLALRFIPPTAPDLVVRELLRIPLAAYVHPDLLARTGVDGLPWVALHDPELRYDETRWLMAHAHPRHLTRVSSWSLLHAAIHSGTAAGIISPAVAQGLVRVPLKAPELPTYALLMVYHRSLRQVPRVRAVREWLVEQAERWREMEGPGGLGQAGPVRGG